MILIHAAALLSLVTHPLHAAPRRYREPRFVTRGRRTGCGGAATRRDGAARGAGVRARRGGWAGGAPRRRSRRRGSSWRRRSGVPGSCRRSGRRRRSRRSTRCWCWWAVVRRRREVASRVRRLTTTLSTGLGVSLDDVPGVSPSLARGAEVYQAQCAQCHGSLGRGDGPAAAGLDPVPANLADAAALVHPVSARFLPADHDRCRRHGDAVVRGDAVGGGSLGGGELCIAAAPAGGAG